MNLVERVQARLMTEGGQATDRSRDRDDRIARLVREEAPLLSPQEQRAGAAAVISAMEGLGALDGFLTEDGVSDVLVNGDGRVWVERRGRLAATSVRMTCAEVERVIERIVAPLGLRIDRSSPVVDARLPDGSRVHAVVPPLAVDGPCLTIRRFGAVPVPLASIAAPAVARLLGDAVAGGANVVIAGGTGSGKTTLLNALAAAIPQATRVVTVEDAAELRLPQANVVRLESRPANAEGVGEVAMRELVRNALRMRPDRIILGECRGPEALDMLQAMNTGHEGSLTTCHANGCEDALRRLETMILFADSGLPLEAIREQIRSAVDLVVHVERQADGTRRVIAVAELTDVGAPGVEAGQRVRHLVTGDLVTADPVRRRCLDKAGRP